MKKEIFKISKNIIHYIYRTLYYCFRIFPIKPGKIVAQSFYGKGYGDSPKAIIDYISAQNSGKWTFFWVVRGGEGLQGLPEEVLPVKIHSLKALYHFATAEYWIDNCRKPAYFSKKKKQKYIQTWHGFPLKKIEGNVENSLEEGYLKSARNDSRMIDLLISNSTFLTTIYQESFWYQGEIGEFGFPKNDILLQEQMTQKTVEKITKYFGFEKTTKLLLYAPTFRQNHDTTIYDLDFAGVQKELSLKFGGDWAILVRFHPNISALAGEYCSRREGCFNATDYPDIQELLVVSSGVITDYSSIMFDIMIKKTPCFLYMNDREEYNKDREFYIPLSDLPFPISEEASNFYQAIADFNINEYNGRLDSFSNEYGLQENGTASQQAYHWMKEKMNAGGLS